MPVPGTKAVQLVGEISSLRGSTFNHRQCPTNDLGHWGCYLDSFGLTFETTTDISVFDGQALISSKAAWIDGRGPVGPNEAFWPAASFLFCQLSWISP